MRPDGQRECLTCMRDRHREYREQHREQERERERGRSRERYRTDPEYRERHLEHERERHRTDPEYRERKRERNRKYYEAEMATPEARWKRRSYKITYNLEMRRQQIEKRIANQPKDELGDMVRQEIERIGARVGKV